MIRSKRQHGIGLNLLMNHDFRIKAGELAHSRPLRRAGKIQNDKPDIWEESECQDSRDRFLLALINKSYNIDKNKEKL